MSLERVELSVAPCHHRSVFDRQLKQAISGHMARGNEHMTVGNELMRRNSDLITRCTEAMVEVRHELELSRRERADMAVFIREITTRSERHSQATVSAIDANTATLNEMREDLAANRTAILSVIDRLEPPPAG